MHDLYAVDTLPDLDAVAQSVADNLANAILAFDLLSDTADPVRRERARLGKHAAQVAIQALRWLAGESL